MLTVILTILKIIGIIIAVLIGLVLLIVLLVGFVPIRYKASGQYPYEGDMNEEVVSRRKRDALMNKVKASDEKEEDEYGDVKKELKIKANAVVSWLLHIVHVTADMDSTGLVITARLFGIFKIYSNDPETVKKKEEKQRKKEEKERLKAEKNGKKNNETDDTELIDEFDETDDAKDESVKQIAEEKTESEKNGQDKDEKKTIEDEEKKEDSESKESKEEKGKEEKEKEENSKEDSEDEEKPSFIDKLIKKYEGIKEKLSKLKKKVDYILDMKDDERVRNGISYAKKKLFLIIKRMLPKKLSGRVAFGMDDPATTGYITGGVSVFYGLWAEHFTLEPDFENKKLEADVSLKGRIMIALLVIPALKVWFNKDIKYIRKRVKKFKKL